MPQKRNKVLFLDDDPSFLGIVKELMAAYAGGQWEIVTAMDTGQALALIQEQRPDLLVLDVHMPVVDGLQFLSLVQRKYPNLLKVVLTGDASEHYRAACLNNGAELFLEKPSSAEGWQTVYSTLNELVRFQPEEGFRGVLRRVGLQDVLQMECLARHSLVLEVSTQAMQGTIVVQGGEIIHAEAGGRVGEEAFNYLMSLTGGEFNLKPFAEPATRSISGSWEFLLMEAARKSDEAREQSLEPHFETNPAVLTPTHHNEPPVHTRPEGTAAINAPSPPSPPAAAPQNQQPAGQPAHPSSTSPHPLPPKQPAGDQAAEDLARSADSLVREAILSHLPEHADSAVRAPSGSPGNQPRPAADETLKPQIEELLICSIQGDVLYQWQCRDPNQRISFLEFLSKKAGQLAQGLPLGAFERLEVQGEETRLVAQIQTDRALLVRSRSAVPKEVAG